MIAFREYRNEDLQKIEQFLEDEVWPLRHLLITERVVTKDDEIVAYGNVRMIPEETIIFNRDKLSKRDKIFILGELLKIAHHDTRELKTFLKLYGFCLEEKFANIMEKHFGYKIDDRKVITFALTE